MDQFFKAKIDKTQQNSKCRLFGDKDETINHKSGCSKLVQRKYKTWHDRLIHRELCKVLIILRNGTSTNQTPS